MARRELSPAGGWAETAAVLTLIALVVLVAGDGWVALHAAAAWHHRPAPPDGVGDLVGALISGTVVWDGAATFFAVAIPLLLTIVVVAGILVLGPSARRVRAGCDRAVRHLATPAELRPLRAPARTHKNLRLGIEVARVAGAVGLPLGAAVGARGRVGPDVYASFEDTVVLIAGPRTNKTTAFAIPMLLAAPGAALATSNKRDILDATREIRRGKGPVWVFDPQRVAGEPTRWWWDPVSFLPGPDGTPEPGRAVRLAAQFTASATPTGARTDAYFDTEKTNLIALLTLAAGCAGEPLTAVWEWLCDPDDPAPAGALEAAGHRLHARALHALASLPDRQRDGVYGSARAVMGFLLDPRVLAWITPAPDRPRFDPHAFAASTQTLYLLSRDGADGAGALVAALVMAVTDALEQQATASPRGRLRVPFVGILDEAANICRIRDLDALYSHYGSRGICLVTILQNWAQGAVVWGPAGMEKLWSAANFAVYGGGVDDPAFLDRCSKLIGTHEHLDRTHTVTGGRRQYTSSVRERTVLTPAELRELPPGRAVVFASGTPAFLIAPRPWWTGPHARTIQTALAETADATLPRRREPDDSAISTDPGHRP